MAMLSFRVAEREAAAAQRWADRLGVDRSVLLRDALRRELDRLAAVEDARIWLQRPFEESEAAIAEIADWGPAEEWSDWSDASRSDASRSDASRSDASG